MLWLLAAAAACLTVLVILFLLVFYAPRRPEPEFPVPHGPAYEPYHAVMIEGMKRMRARPFETFTTRSHDGMTLSGRYFEFASGAPIEIMFHGYRGTADRDLCVGVDRAFALGHSCLIVDQRTTGGSGGRIITFGIREYRDCLRWVDFAVEHFGPEIRIILTGISMGASTVLMAAGEDLPTNVVGVLADCGYTSAKAIIRKVSRQLHLPAWFMYPAIRLSARLFAGLDLEENSPIEAMGRARVPVIFAHGGEDTLVPCSMSRENYEACAAPKSIFIAPDAGHGMCYLATGDDYIRALRDFWTEQGVYERDLVR
ncbi:MAG: alpha/beta hydrolase [Oscillospiraceae bacterium]|nr:alpha/beta hydrolase [Oscillospiraceae bacterium]